MPYVGEVQQLRLLLGGLLCGRVVLWQRLVVVPLMQALGHQAGRVAVRLERLLQMRDFCFKVFLVTDFLRSAGTDE